MLLSYVDIHDEEIPSDVVLHGLKQKDGNFVVRIYGVHDNPKDTLESGGSLFGAPILINTGITEEELWDGGGGFLQAVMKKGVTRQDVHNRLKEVFEDSDVDVWDSQLV